MSSDECEPTTSSPEMSQLNSRDAESPANGDDSEGTFDDAVESMDERTPENSSSIAEDDGEDDVSGYVSSPDRSDLGWEMVDGKVAISFHPDYIVYRDIYCTDSKVTFSASCVQVTGSAIHGSERLFSIELAIDDMICIRSHWCARFLMAEVTLHVITRDSVEDENTNGSSGTEKLEFVVVDTHWYDKIGAILSLNVRYKGLWDVMLNTELDIDQEALFGQKPMLLPKKYFPKFDENFEEVIYPQGDSDAVSISMRDVDLLKPDTFVNDTIIDFYIKYLKNKILPEERHRFHFFNCFFFRKLADMDKDPSSAFEGRAAFLRVRKWTRKLNLFDKDFIFIPVNYNYHWSLIVICHPGEITNIRDEDIEKSDRVPCILHMDSLKGSHANLKDLMQSYLWEEWKERQKGEVNDISSKFLNMRFVSLELPQQQNLYDCGLYLLHYVERFLEEAPRNFSPFMITKLDNFLTVGWFPTAEPSIKRGVIHRLIYDLLKKHSQSPSSNSEKQSSHNPRIHNDNEDALELSVERLGHLKGNHGHLLNSDGEQGIEMDLLQAPSFRGSRLGTNDSGLELFDPTPPALLLDAEYQAFGRTTSFNEFRSGLPPIQEEVEADMHLVQTTLTETGFQHLDLVTPEVSALQYAPKDDRSEAACDQRTCLEEKHDELPEKSTYASENAPGIEIAENFPVGEKHLDDKVDDPVTAGNINTPGVEIAENCPVGETCLDDKADHPVTAENISCLGTHGCTPSETMEADKSEDPVQMLDHDAVTPTCLENLSEISHQKEENSDQETDAVLSGTIQLVSDNLGSESDAHPAAKKMRLTCPLEAEREVSSTNPSSDLHL